MKVCVLTPQPFCRCDSRSMLSAVRGCSCRLGRGVFCETFAPSYSASSRHLSLHPMSQSFESGLHSPSLPVLSPVPCNCPFVLSSPNENVLFLSRTLSLGVHKVHALAAFTRKKVCSSFQAGCKFNLKPARATQPKAASGTGTALSLRLAT